MIAAGTIALLLLLPLPGRPGPLRGDGAAPQDDPFEALVASHAERTPEASQRRRRAVEALAATSPSAAREVLGQASAPGAPVERVRAALFALAYLGTSEDLPLVLRLGRPESEADFEYALTGILVRCDDALRSLDPLMSEAETDLRSSILAVVERRGTLVAAEHVARWCREHASLRREALARLGRMATRLEQPLPEALRRCARDVLAGADGECLSTAILAAGQMRDSDAIAHLLPLLEDGRRSICAEARWALEQISGLRLGTHPGRWRTWFEGERAWWQGESESAFRALAGADRAAKMRALLDVVRRHAWRDLLALRVRPLAQDEDREVAALAARTLRQLEARPGAR